MDKRRIDQFAKSNLYSRADYAGEWKGYEVYEMIFGDGKGVDHVGLPRFALVKGNRIRTSTDDEGFAILDHLYPEEDE